MTDITHDNIFTNSDTVPRLRRILDEGPALPGRAADHELAPHHVPAKEKTGGEMIAEQAIGNIDKATDIGLDTIDKLIEQAIQTKEILQRSKIHTHDVIRNHMVITEMSMKSTQQLAEQLVEATKALAALSNGGGNAGQ